jgi:serine/threonine-protein kinase
MPMPKAGDLVAHKFRIEGSLGEGGMAHVLAAHHELLDKPVAMKILDPAVLADAASVSSLIDRFLAEARAAARVDSHHVARIMDVGTLEDGGLPYIVMERLEGSNLEQLLALEKTLRIEDAIDFVLQALAGLAHAHALGIIHRDLKPANLFLARQRDGGSIIKILDFGVAKLMDAREGKMTLDGTAVGTPLYMAPEQIRTPAIVDMRVDIWATGVVLYELLAGVPPFEGDGMPAIFASVLESEIKSVRTHRPEVPEGLDRVILKCLERDLGKRYRDVGTLAHDLAPYGSGQWHALVDHIDATLHGRASVVSGPELTPTGLPVRRPEHKSPSTETNIVTPKEPMAPVSRTSIWRVLVLSAAVAGAIVWGVKQHAFDSLVKGNAPPVLPDAPSASVSAPVASSSAAPSATPAKSTRPPPPATTIKKPPPKPTTSVKKR